MENTERIKKLKNALTAGSPMRIALSYAGIPYSEYRYWLILYVAVERCEQEKEIAELEKSKSNLAKIRKSAYEFSTIEDDEGNLIEPDPEAMTLYRTSRSFRKEADEAHRIMSEIMEAKTKSVILHLGRLAKEDTSKAAVSASQWFLERALPTDFGKKEKEERQDVPAIEVKFVKSDSEASLKRVADMEKSILGDRNEA